MALNQKICLEYPLLYSIAAPYKTSLWSNITGKYAFSIESRIFHLHHLRRKAFQFHIFRAYPNMKAIVILDFEKTQLYIEEEPLLEDN